MARTSLRLPHNLDGDFYVDSTCIDCDTCRSMAPDVFTRRESQSSVWRQPADDQEQERALMALLSCPTASIGTVEKHDMQGAIQALPELIVDDVYHCGYHAEKSFGAASYLIVRPAGNVLIDSPRFNGPLVQRLEDLGGVATMFLTHRDDAVDHAKFRKHFGCERVLHRADLTDDTRDVEGLIDGTDPIRLDDDIVLLPVPGHTEGSTCLLYRERFLFSGDHIAFSADRGHIYGFRSACWYSWDELVASTERLARERFEWVLPGHGRRCQYGAEEMQRQMKLALAWMRSVA